MDNYRKTKTYRKLLKAWLKGNVDKAIALQHKLLRKELDEKNE